MGSSVPNFNWYLHYLMHVQSYSPVLAYIIWLRPLTLEFNLIWNSAPIHFTAKVHNIILCCRENCLLSGIWIKEQNLVCNELAMLKILDDVSETLFNVLDKVCLSFGAKPNSAPDGELTDQNLWVLSLIPWLCMFSLHERMNKQTKFQ